MTTGSGWRLPHAFATRRLYLDQHLHKIQLFVLSYRPCHLSSTSVDLHKVSFHGFHSYPVDFDLAVLVAWGIALSFPDVEVAALRSHLPWLLLSLTGAAYLLGAFY